MKVKKIILVFIVFNSFFNSSYTQSKIGLEISEGWMFFDLLKKEQGLFDDYYSGYGLQQEISLVGSSQLSNKIGMSYCVGYFNYYYLDFKITDPNHYVSFKYHINFSTPLEKIKVNVGVGYQYLLNKGDFHNIQQKRSFMNLLFGFTFMMKKDWDLFISSPITLFPMAEGEIGFFEPHSVKYNYWVETIGLSIGVRYNFIQYNNK